jgi:sulfur carrier protein ThiS
VTVTVKMFGQMAEYLPPNAKGRRAKVELDGAATVDVLCEDLGIEDVPMVILVNGQQAHRAISLSEGDEVSFLAPLAGGLR